MSSTTEKDSLLKNGKPMDYESGGVLSSSASSPVVNPELKANCISRITFSWLSDVLSRGAKKVYEAHDLYPLLEQDTSELCTRKLTEEWKRERMLQSSKPSLVRSIRKAFGYNMYIAGICKLLGDLFGFVGPICLNGIVKYLEDPSTAWFYPQYFGYILSVALFVSSVASTLCLHHHHKLVIREGIHARTALTGLVFEKSLKLSMQDKQRLGSGRIINHQSTDASRIMDVFYFIHYTWAAPLQILIAMLLLVQFMGYSALAGLAVMVIILPISGATAALIGKISKKMLLQTDKRVKLLNEILQGIRVVKFYAWEEKLNEAIKSIRQKEISYLRSTLFCTSFNQTVLQGAPIVVALVSFCVYSIFESTPLTPDIAFTSISLFNIFRLPMMILPMIFSILVQASVSITRLEEFLSLDEIMDNTLTCDDVVSSTNAIEIRNATFVLDRRDEASSAALKDVNLSVGKGHLVMVVGNVGSGKSTLLTSLLGEVFCERGSVVVSGQIAYVSQHAWILNATIRDNILFGKPFDAKRFNEVVRICCLEADFKVLPAGAETEIGERGVTLSGGQKQRVSIARAVYSDKDIYVFDDCFSALDSHVGRLLFEECICRALHNKTRLLVTHALQFLAQADNVVVMKDMAIQERGTYAELLKKSDSLLSSMIKGPKHQGTRSVLTENLASSDAVAFKKEPVSESNLDLDDASDGKLMDVEERNHGSVSLGIYLSYLRSSGIFVVIIVGFLIVITQFLVTAADLWLTNWTSASDSQRHMTYYLKVYGVITCTSIVLLYASDIAWRLTGLRASRRIHQGLMSSILKAPMQFFDTTPVGRIINRFSNDINVIDQKLNASFKSYLTYGITVINFLIVQSVVTPYVLIVIVPSFFMYLFIQQYYRKTSRELQRLDSVSKSPILAHFGQTLNGLVTLRAYNMQRTFIIENESRVDKNTQAYWLLNLVNRWLGVRLEFLGALITAFVAISLNASLGSINPAIAGLVLTYSQTITGLLNWIVRTTIDTENQLNSVERTDEYRQVQPEAAAIIESNRPAPSWPSRGAITFQKVSARYRNNLDLVLKNVSFSIQGGEKVGICGRTGSGKSSLMILIFRLIEACEGAIRIDDVDTASIGLYDLRSKIAIIPQDPVLFAQTIRFNLDPFAEHSDAQLWGAIEKSKLGDVVRAVPGQLDGEITEGGDNFSVGERQLFCLARALLRNSKILLLDEATASVDHSTDEYIQEQIRKNFNHCTVIAIAHRLETIMDYDRILVLDQGRVQEYDTPRNLLLKEGGALRTLSGDRVANFLELAK